MGNGKENALCDAIYERFITPTIGRNNSYAGVEFELPVYNLRGDAVDYDVVHGLTDAFIEEFGADDIRHDDDGYVYFAENGATGDSISFDCSYNTFEIAFGREKSLCETGNRFCRYYDFACNYLRQRDHTLVGMGINPGYRVNRRDPVSNGRYRMLLHHLDSYRRYPEARGFHDVPYYGLIVCASQTHVDVSERDVVRNIHLYEKLEPIKGLLFANSPYEGGYLCVRDHFWRDSMHGFNPRNVDCWGEEVRSLEDIVDYISGMSLFCCERDEKYINFRPLPASEYMAADTVRGEYYDGNKYREIEVIPDVSDVDHLRSYKYVDLTFRGTIELRSACMQPAYQAMSVPAFNLGIRENFDRLEELLAEHPLYRQGYDPARLRRLSVMYDLPDFLKGKAVSELLLNVVDLAYQGLEARGFGEEKYLRPLYDRAEQILSPAREMTEGMMKGAPAEKYIREYAEIKPV